MLVIIDNYDSFTYNLKQMLGSIESDISVVRNDAVSVEDIAQMNPDGIVLSPGPGMPKDAGICEELVLRLTGRIPILGVCLGHQAICEAFGARIVHAKRIMHGKSSEVVLNTGAVQGTSVTYGASVVHGANAAQGTEVARDISVVPGAPSLFSGIKSPCTVARYHSLIAERESLPSCLIETAHTKTGELMAVQHLSEATYGVQFHPESILTKDGARILTNFVKICRNMQEKA